MGQVGVGIKACIVRSTRRCMEVLSHYVVHLKLIEQCTGIYLFIFLKILCIYLTERQPAREGTQAGGVGEEESGS